MMKQKVTNKTYSMFYSLCFLTVIFPTFSNAKEKDLWIDVTEKINRSLRGHLPSMPKEAPHQLPKHKVEVNYEKAFFSSETGCEIYFNTNNKITVRATENGYIELLGVDDKGFKETIGFRMNFLKERKDHNPVPLVPRGIIKEKCVPVMDKLPSPYNEKFDKQYNQKDRKE